MRARVAREARARETAVEEAHVVWLVDSIGARLSAPTGRPSAEQRMQRLLERVRVCSASDLSGS